MGCFVAWSYVLTLSETNLESHESLQSCRGVLMCVEACKWVGIKIVIQRNKYTVHLNEAKTVWEFEWWCYINIRSHSTTADDSEPQGEKNCDCS